WRTAAKSSCTRGAAASGCGCRRRSTTIARTSHGSATPWRAECDSPSERLRWALPCRANPSLSERTDFFGVQSSTVPNAGREAEMSTVVKTGLLWLGGALLVFIGLLGPAGPLGQVALWYVTGGPPLD